MTSGLYIVTVPGGYAPYVLVGWAEVNGLEVTLHGCRVLRRFGANNAIAQLAEKGPLPGTELLPASAREEFWRPNFGRVIPADPAAWAVECPDPRIPAVAKKSARAKATV